MVYSFCIIGSDNRMKYVYRHLYERGLDVCFADDREYLVWDYKNIILIAPPKPDYGQIKSMMETGGIHSFFGGALNSDFYSLGDANEVRIYDYLKDDEVVWENAVLTAGGIVAEAVKNAGELSKGIFGHSNSLILGYGNCGKAIAQELMYRKSPVFIAVRRADLKTEIETAGHGYVNISELSQFLRAGEYSYIYNTIPAMVLDKNAIDSLKAGTVIYDIASAPGGTDFDYCREKGIEAYFEPGIPGRCYPDEAGRIIAGYVSRIIFE